MILDHVGLTKIKCFPMGGGGGNVEAFFRHFYLKFKIGTNMALKFLKDKSWVCGEVIVRNLYGVPLYKCSF